MKKIIAAIDLTDISEMITNQVGQLATKFDSEVWLIHVAEPEPDFVGHDVDTGVMRDQIAKHFHHEHSQLQLLAEQLRGHGVKARALLIQGSTAETLVEQVKKLDADLLVIGKNRHGLIHRLLLGSNCKDIARLSPVPTLIIPGMPS